MNFDDAFFSAEHVRDPIGPLAELRSKGSVHYSDLLHGWAVLGWDDSRTVMKHRGIGQGDRLAAYVTNLPPADAARLSPISDHMDRAISFLDPPDHTTERLAAGRVFDAGIGHRIEPELREIVRARIDGLADRESFDGVDDFALPVTVAMICSILGIRYQDRENFVGWVERIFAYLGSDMTDPARAEDCKNAYAELSSYVLSLFDEARSNANSEPRTLIELLLAPSASHDLTERDLMGMVVGMVQGGFETTTTLISNVIAMVLQDPEQRREIDENRNLLPSAIEEVLRLAPSLKFNVREALVDVELSDGRVSAGEKVIPVILAANRDPSVFAQPNAFDITRRPNPHLSFGFGTHFCLGGPLARMHTNLAVGELLERFPDLTVASDALEWRASALLRRLVSLPLATHS